MTDDWVEVGRVRSVNAPARELRVNVRDRYGFVFKALPWIRFRQGPERPLRCKVLRCRLDGDVAIVTLSPGVSRDIVGQLRGAVALLAADEVPATPQAPVRLDDLLGLTVIQASGDVLGTVEEVYEGPANDAFAVGRKAGGQCVLPLIDAVVEHIDLDRREMRVGDITPFVVEDG